MKTEPATADVASSLNIVIYLFRKLIASYFWQP